MKLHEVAVVVMVAVWWSGMVEAACPTLQLKKNFKSNKYLGKWYEIQAQESMFQLIKSCLASAYTRETRDSLRVVSRGLDSSGAPAKTSSILKIVDPNNPAHMVTDFVPGVSPPFDIVDTDYTTYSCAHSCLSVVGIKTEFLFIYSRNRTLETRLVNHCRSMFENVGLDTTTLENTHQQNCPEDRAEL